MSFKRTQVCKAALAAIGGAVVLTSVPAMAQDPQRVEVTGSRIKRVDVEGTLPVTTINREELQASGAATVAEFMRTIPFASTGNFRPQSGSSAQSFAEIDLRGLGSNRTLVLIDGRRAAKGPMVGDAVDLNIIPMAMIERVEVLTDGASAIYGSDAIAGVVNFITRKDFQGIEVMASAARPRVDGGDRDEASVVMGIQGERGRMFGGASYSSREIIFARERPWPITPGASVYGNNYTTNDAEGNDRFNFRAIPDGCNDPAFYLTGGGTVCRYDFKTVSADEASSKNSAAFVNGEYEITADWTGYMAASVSRVESFGRYAPTPGFIPISIDSPNNPLRGVEAVNLYHRFAAAGTRDTSTDNNYYNLVAGVRGVFAGVDLDAGFRRSDSQYYELGRNYIVRPIAQQYFNDGTYDVKNPSGNDPDILNAIKATINRDARFLDQEFYTNGTFGAFDLSGGKAMANVGLEYRKETFYDRYDSLQEAGVIEGSAGNSSGGDRNVWAAFGELVMPFTSALEANISLRYENYSDYGSDLAPKAGLRWKVLPNLALRASAGQGFRAPSLPILTQKETFSAESVVDPRSCAVLNPGEEDCQVNTYTLANSQLDSEKSTQYSFGGVWDITPAISLKADYWNVKIKDQITQIDAQDLVDRDNGTDPRAIPPGLSVARNAAGVITRINSGYANEGTVQTDGLDISVAGAYQWGGYGRFRSELRWSHVFSYEEGGFDFAGSIGQPDDRGMWVNSWSNGPFAAAWNINYLGRNEFQPNSNDARSVGSYTTHDVQFTWQTPLKGSALTVGVINLFDKLPQLVTYDGREFNFNLYDAYGRTAYVRYTQQF